VQYEVEVNGRIRSVTLSRNGTVFTATLDGKQWTVDAARVGTDTLSMIVVRPDAASGSKTGASPAPGGPSHEVTISSLQPAGQLTITTRGVPVPAFLNGRRRWGRNEERGHLGSGPQRLLAPMPGKVMRILVGPGQPVRARQPIVVIEAMKMENEVRASGDGSVSELHVKEGQSVDAGALLAVVTPA
jgi:biotin carboxyl carrier protein